MLETVRWLDGKVRILDQSRLPQTESYLEISAFPALIDSIKELKVRGAPALGIAGAYGVCLGLAEEQHRSIADFKLSATEAVTQLCATRPTAVNLGTGAKHVLKTVLESEGKSSDAFCKALKSADDFLEDDLSRCAAISKLGAPLMPSDGSVLTHCNTGGLATGGIGTALGVIIEAHKNNPRLHVYVDETRPLLQGARLTTWELARAGVKHTLITDSAAGHVMAAKKVKCVIVGADRIAANGDTANKVGTYGLAVLCEKHRIPFYVAAPFTTVDLGTSCGEKIIIEERSMSELSDRFSTSPVPIGTEVYNPAFDVTPASLITAIITERGISKGPTFNFA